jgi:hypothetical protein
MVDQFLPVVPSEEMQQTIDQLAEGQRRHGAVRGAVDQLFLEDVGLLTAEVTVAADGSQGNGGEGLGGGHGCTQVFTGISAPYFE